MSSLAGYKSISVGTGSPILLMSPLKRTSPKSPVSALNQLSPPAVAADSINAMASDGGNGNADAYDVKTVAYSRAASVPMNMCSPAIAEVSLMSQGSRLAVPGSSSSIASSNSCGTCESKPADAAGANANVFDVLLNPLWSHSGLYQLGLVGLGLGLAFGLDLNALQDSRGKGSRSCFSLDTSEVEQNLDWNIGLHASARDREAPAASASASASVSAPVPASGDSGGGSDSESTGKGTDTTRTDKGSSAATLVPTTTIHRKPTITDFKANTQNDIENHSKPGEACTPTRKKKVTFNSGVKVVLIATRREVCAAGLASETWWQRSDYEEMKGSATSELLEYMRTTKDCVDVKTALRQLYQPYQPAPAAALKAVPAIQAESGTTSVNFVPGPSVLLQKLNQQHAQREQQLHVEHVKKQ